MPESLMRHARGMPGYSDLAEESAAVLAAVRHAAAVLGSGAGADEVAMLAAHVGEMRAQLARLATAELAVEEIYRQGRRDEREAARTARGRHAAGRARPYLRAVKAIIPAAFIGSGALIRHALGAHRLHVAAAAMTTAALTSAVTITAVTVPYTTAPPPAVPPPAAPAPPATVPAPAALVKAAPHRHHVRRHRAAVVIPHPSPVTASPPRQSPSPPPPPASPAAPGTVTAPPVILAGGTGQLVLTAEGGPAAWSLTCTPELALSAQSGHLDAGQSVTITVTSASPMAGGTIWLQPGGIPVQVRAPQ
jgi:hypothetical protein